MRDDVLRAARAVVVLPDGASPLRRGLAPALLGTLLLLVAADAAHRAGWPAFAHTQWNAAPDASRLELFRGAQMLAAAALLAFLARRRRPAPVLLAWAVALTVLTADDLLGFHERLGTLAARAFGLRAVHGIGGQDQGELVAWAVIAVALGAATAVAHRRSSRSARVASWLVAAGVALQAASAVGLDGLGAALEERVGPVGSYLLTVSEFTGESLGATVVLLAAASLVTQVTPVGAHRSVNGSQSGQSSATGSADSTARTSTLTETSGSAR